MASIAWYLQWCISVTFRWRYVANLMRPLLGGSCSADWHYYNGTESCFYTSTTKVGQEEARKQCLKMSADLASISNQAEMDFVNSISWVMTVTQWCTYGALAPGARAAILKVFKIYQLKSDKFILKVTFSGQTWVKRHFDFFYKEYGPLSEWTYCLWFVHRVKWCHSNLWSLCSGATRCTVQSDVVNIFLRYSNKIESVG